MVGWEQWMRCFYCKKEISDDAQVCRYCGLDPTPPERGREQLEQIGQELREKIRSKIQTVTVLAGFASVLLGLQITMLWQPEVVPPQLLFLSIPLMSVAASLYIYAILMLDSLLMPKYFWEEGTRAAQRETLGHRYKKLITLLVTEKCSEYVYPGVDRRSHGKEEVGSLEEERVALDYDLRTYAEQQVSSLNNDLVSLGGRMVWYWSMLTAPATYVVAISLLMMLLPLSWANINFTEYWTFAALLIAIGTTVTYCRRIEGIAKKRWPLPSLYD